MQAHFRRICSRRGCKKAALAAGHSIFIRCVILTAGGDDLHGSARFATRKDIEKAGLLGQEEGLFVGGWIDGGMLNYLRHSGPESVIVIAPPRSGKGVSLVVPVLLDHKANAVIHDTKGELWHIPKGTSLKAEQHVSWL